MKHQIVALMTILVIGLGAMGASPVAAADIRQASGLVPAAVQFVDGQSHVRLTRQGRIRVTGTYVTADPFTVVLSRYSGPYDPVAGGPHKAGHCVILWRSDRYLALRQSVLVTLCPLPHGTQISVERNLYLGW